MEATSNSTSRSLLRCVLAGETAAWDRFAEIYVPLVYRWTRQAGLQESDARDVCQNVFVNLVKNLPKFHYGQPGHSLRAWLRTITKHAVVDWARKRQKQVQSGPSPEEMEKALARTDGEPSSIADRNEIVRRALELVRSDFEPATWQMFWQFQVEGKTAEEIAAAREVSVWSVYKARSRVLARLRELLGEFFPLAK